MRAHAVIQPRTAGDPSDQLVRSPHAYSGRPGGSGTAPSCPPGSGSARRAGHSTPCAAAVDRHFAAPLALAEDPQRPLARGQPHVLNVERDRLRDPGAGVERHERQRPMARRGARRDHEQKWPTHSFRSTISGWKLATRRANTASSMQTSSMRQIMRSLWKTPVRIWPMSSSDQIAPATCSRCRDDHRGRRTARDSRDGDALAIPETSQS